MLADLHTIVVRNVSELDDAEAKRLGLGRWVLCAASEARRCDTCSNRILRGGPPETSSRGESRRDREGIMSESIVTARRNNGRQRPRGYASWRPREATLKLLGQVEQVLGEYSAHLPLTVRQIFYRLVAQHGYDKTERAYERLGNMLVRARRAKLVPFESIRDDGVVTRSTRFYGGVEDFEDDTARRAKSYRRDRQTGQDQYIELWCEASGMLQQLARVADPYSVPVYSCSGFASLTATYNIAARALDRDVPTVLLHVGDFDPSGESIFSAMAEDAAAFVEKDRSIGLLYVEAKRVALTAAQVAKYSLVTSPPKSTDSRSAKWTGGTCQLEALSPSLLANVVEAAIDEWIDLDTYADEVDREKDDRAELLGLPPGGTV